MPGGEVMQEADNARAYTEAVRMVLGELDRGAHLPEMPGRGAIADMIGRGLAVVSGLAADLQPAGWRLTGGGVGVDQRRARSLLSQDLDTVEELAQDYDGIFKVQVAGPWTLAASVEKPRGDKILADHGARRDLAQGLAEGLRDHVADVRRRMPRAARLVVQIDEPALPAVMQARIPTASGFGRHRRVDPPEASALLAEVLGAVTAAGAEAWVHSCAAEVPWGLVSGAGATGLLVDLDRVDATAIDHLATHLEGGGALGLGVVPSTDPTSELSDKAVTERVLRWLDMVGFDPEEYAGQLVVTPSCGMAGASTSWARRALGLAGATARHLS
ncbi:methionine synthase [Nocardioides jishulii]|uniref:Methionine synthase n=2 Tax=Nocardioides jishulii TaxID=2575440 RepID=A0A4U2YLR2_9ACTN|nr:methionine synthase [Nocardioides jishulii]TKI61860.1 methionine synthase [Nocardioides jishulii]